MAIKESFHQHPISFHIERPTIGSLDDTQVLLESILHFHLDGQPKLWLAIRELETW